MKVPKGFVTIQEAAKRLGLTRETVHRWIKVKKLSSKKPGKQRIIPLSEVEKFQ